MSDRMKKYAEEDVAATLLSYAVQAATEVGDAIFNGSLRCDGCLTFGSNKRIVLSVSGQGSGKIELIVDGKLHKTW